MDRSFTVTELPVREPIDYRSVEPSSRDAPVVVSASFDPCASERSGSKFAGTTVGWSIPTEGVCTLMILSGATVSPL